MNTIKEQKNKLIVEVIQKLLEIKLYVNSYSFFYIINFFFIA